MRNLLAAAIGNAFAMLVVILLAFWLLGDWFVWLLRVVLETINSI